MKCEHHNLIIDTYYSIFQILSFSGKFEIWFIIQFWFGLVHHHQIFVKKLIKYWMYWMGKEKKGSEYFIHKNLLSNHNFIPPKNFAKQRSQFGNLWFVLVLAFLWHHHLLKKIFMFTIIGVWKYQSTLRSGSIPFITKRKMWINLVLIIINLIS